eukprot:TRINITY_DN7682_c0_g1_i2.p1 TRINITY_DN7682_c0_g1~~TRINITY_DN7682_c0_g1_i2.p1  ORF type:complete len:252 (+),score=49.62 TRINITY_DN7682_c0_g1_i2:3-758(+)
MAYRIRPVLQSALRTGIVPVSARTHNQNALRLAQHTHPILISTRFASKGKKGKKASKGKGPVASFDLNICPLDLDKIEEKISGQVNHLKVEYSSIRTGEVSPALLDNVKVTMGGATFPLQQAAQVAVKNNNTLLVSCFDPDTATAAFDAIKASEIAPNPVKEDLNIKVQLPLLTKEYRQQVAKKAKEQLEKTKQALRKARSHSLGQLKKQSDSLSKDEIKAIETYIGGLYDKGAADAEDLFQSKQTEVLQS